MSEARITRWDGTAGAITAEDFRALGDDYHRETIECHDMMAAFSYLDDGRVMLRLSCPSGWDLESRRLANALLGAWWRLRERRRNARSPEQLAP